LLCDFSSHACSGAALQAVTKMAVVAAASIRFMPG
jgi:hypothetical protein